MLLRIALTGGVHHVGRVGRRRAHRDTRPTMKMRLFFVIRDSSCVRTLTFDSQNVNVGICCSRQMLSTLHLSIAIVTRSGYRELQPHQASRRAGGAHGAHIRRCARCPAGPTLVHGVRRVAFSDMNRFPIAQVVVSRRPTRPRTCVIAGGSASKTPCIMSVKDVSQS